MNFHYFLKIENCGFSFVLAFTLSFSSPLSSYIPPTKPRPGPGKSSSRQAVPNNERGEKTPGQAVWWQSMSRADRAEPSRASEFQSVSLHPSDGEDCISAASSAVSSPEEVRSSKGSNTPPTPPSSRKLSAEEFHAVCATCEPLGSSPACKYWTPLLRSRGPPLPIYYEIS